MYFIFLPQDGRLRLISDTPPVYSALNNVEVGYSVARRPVALPRQWSVTERLKTRYPQTRRHTGWWKLIVGMNNDNSNDSQDENNIHELRGQICMNLHDSLVLKY